jgi:hypothetical protein
MASIWSVQAGPPTQTDASWEPFFPAPAHWKPLATAAISSSRTLPYQHTFHPPGCGRTNRLLSASPAVLPACPPKHPVLLNN